MAKRKFDAIHTIKPADLGMATNRAYSKLFL